MDDLPPTALHRVVLCIVGSLGLDVQRSATAVRLGQASVTQRDFFALVSGLAQVDPGVLATSPLNR